MRIRTLLSASAFALVAASCSQPEPHVLSEAPRSAATTDLTSTATTTERDAEPGRFIARCATEADGGTPGMTVFTDGTESVTDHCLSRYYIGVQPAPGALYVPDEDTGTYAPSRRTTDESTPTQQWTPAQPRTDAGAEKDQAALDQLQKDKDLEDTTSADEETTPEDAPDTETPTSGATPTTTTPTKPGETTTPGDTEPTSPTTPGETDPTTPGSSEPSPTTTVPVPTVTETPDPSPSTSQTSVTSTAPSGPLGSTGSHGVTGSGLSESLQGSAPTYVPYPFRGPR